MLTKIKKSIPRKWRIALLKMKYKGNGYYCNCCNSDIKHFIPGNPSPKVIKEKEIIGAGYYEHDVCPVCKSSYRQRSVMVYLHQSGILEKDIQVLHVAPEPSLHYVFTGRKNITYRCGDIEPEKYRYYAKAQYLNLLELAFGDNTFDLIVCNHVLEHIEDDLKAMKELFRVLKPGGTAVLQVPISWKSEKTFEDPSVRNPEERLQLFGQSDHVRIYGKDYIDRLQKAGFIVELSEPGKYERLYSDKFPKLMLDPRDKIFACKK